MFAASESISKNKFTYAEDRRLRKYVRLFGNDWKAIASKMLVKNSRQCKDRWEKYLSPSISHSPFSVDEDILILKHYNAIGPKWMQIARYINGRTDVLIKARFRYLMKHGHTLESLEASKNKTEKIEEQQTQVVDNDIFMDTFDFDFFDAFNDTV